MDDVLAGRRAPHYAYGGIRDPVRVSVPLKRPGWGDHDWLQRDAAADHDPAGRHLPDPNDVTAENKSLNTPGARSVAKLGPPQPTISPKEAP
jgi:hypothetical protein